MASRRSGTYNGGSTVVGGNNREWFSKYERKPPNWRHHVVPKTAEELEQDERLKKEMMGSTQLLTKEDLAARKIRPVRLKRRG